MRVIDSKAALVAEFRRFYEPKQAAEVAAEKIRAFGLPVYSHRDHGDDCPPGCCGGWSNPGCLAPPTSQDNE